MADNVTAPAIGLAFATDEVGGVHWPYAKLATGGNGVAAAVQDADGARVPVQIGGTLPAFAAAPTFNVGAVPAIASTTRGYGYASGQRITTAGTGQVRSVAIDAAEVLLHASGRGFFRVGDAAVSAAVGAGSIPLEAGEKFHLRITSGQFISFIRDGSTDASLTIMPVAA